METSISDAVILTQQEGPAEGRGRKWDTTGSTTPQQRPHLYAIARKVKQQNTMLFTTRSRFVPIKIFSNLSICSRGRWEKRQMMDTLK